MPNGEWADKTAIIVATGPSLTLSQVRAIALKRTNSDRYRVVAVNDAVLNVWFADLCFSADGKWWAARRGLNRHCEFAGKRIGLAQSKPADDYGLEFVERVGSEGFSAKPGTVFSNANSGDMATQLTAQFLPARIVLVGFDMHPAADGARHYFGPYAEKQLQSSADMNTWVENFRATAAALAGRLFNATPGSALNFIPFIDLAAV